MPNQPRVLKKEVLEKLKKEKLKKETLKDFDPRLKVFNENKVKELINKKFGSPVLNRRGGTVKSKKKK
jgi:hypothetical protein